MEEKIKITISKRVYDILQKDCIDFGVIKKDDSANMNAFINMLVANFYEEFSLKNEQLNQKLKMALKDIPKLIYDTTFNDILKIMQNHNDAEVDKKSVKINLNFKPTKVSENAIFNIDNLILKNESLASFYRRLFNAYVQKPRPLREQIIFKPIYDKLLFAKKNNCTVCVSFSKNSILKDVSLFDIASSRDELYNYVLLANEKKPYTIRLANITNVAHSQKSGSILPEIANNFAKQIECGVQYPIYQNQSEIVKVKLTAEGKELFKRIYLYRPTPISVDGNIYSFDCSYNQVMFYFKRLGDVAVIIEPKPLGEEMLGYHRYSLRKYSKVYKKKSDQDDK